MSAITLVGILAAWYAVENIRGQRLWAATCRDLQARGESLDRADFIPPAIPDDQNLAFAPLFVRLYEYKVDPATGVTTFPAGVSANGSKIMDYLPFGAEGRQPKTGEWTTGRPLELAKFQAYYRGRHDFPRAPEAGTPSADVLLALTRYTPLLEELACDAAERPLTRFPVNWTQSPASMLVMPHGNFIQIICVALRLRACAELAAGQTDDALRDIQLGFRLCRALVPEPSLIARLVETTSLKMILQPVWEGLAARRWSAAQLGELQRQVREVDLIRGYQWSARGERALFFIPLRTELRQTAGFKQMLNSISEGAGESSKNRLMVRMSSWFPGGWFDEAESMLCRLDQTVVIDTVDPGAHRILARKFDAGEAMIQALPITMTTFLPKVSLPIYSGVPSRVARTQAAVDEAATACALERFYLEHQAYPATLEDLAPSYLEHPPGDVIDGLPMRYAATPGGRYRLWEVGWNGTDENGKIVFYPKSSQPNDHESDWVWQYDAVKLPTVK